MSQYIGEYINSWDDDEARSRAENLRDAFRQNVYASGNWEYYQRTPNGAQSYQEQSRQTRPRRISVNQVLRYIDSDRLDINELERIQTRVNQRIDDLTEVHQVNFTTDLNDIV